MVAPFEDEDYLTRFFSERDLSGKNLRYRDLHKRPADSLRKLMDQSLLPDPRLIEALLGDGRATVRASAAIKKEGMERKLRRLRGKKNIRLNERVFREGGYRVIAGVDEVGRGALAGPLVAAAVVVEKGAKIPGANDSKMLSPAVREELYQMIMSRATDVSVVWVDQELIDEYGLQTANIAALHEAVAGLSLTPDCVICDNYSLEACETAVFGLPKADSTFFSVALASIVAKVERDRLMTCFHKKYPAYGFDHNKGYATPEHLEALRELGPSPVHRFSFHGVLGPEEEGRLW